MNYRGFCFQEYRFNLYSLHFQGEFCRYSEGFYLCFVGLSRGRSLILAVVANSPVDELCARVKSPELIRIISSCDITVSSQDSAIVSGLLTEKSDLRSCFCV